MLGQVEPLTCMRHSLRELTTCALSQVICYPKPCYSLLVSRV